MGILNLLLLKARHPLGIVLMTLFNVLLVVALFVKIKMKFPGPTPLWVYPLLLMLLMPGLGRIYWWLRYRNERLKKS